jgi:hypothetical protein
VVEVELDLVEHHLPNQEEQAEPAVQESLS